MKKMKSLVMGVLCFTVLSLSAYADGNYNTHRLSLGFGVVQTTAPSSQTTVAVGGEYEYRLEPQFGTGLLGSYIFSNPGIATLGLPFYYHPFASNVLVSAGPIVEFGGGRSASFGARVGMRVPITLGAATIVPAIAIDFFGFGQIYEYGLSIGI